MPKYYLVSVSNWHNLRLCMKYNLAGFPHTASGFWTYLEIEEGDFVSFLFDAQLWNLYTVKKSSLFKGQTIVLRGSQLDAKKSTSRLG